jgi:hypothetical protein
MATKAFAKSPEIVSEVAGPQPRVVYTQAPVLLGRLLERDGERWRVHAGGRDVWLEADASVDPALLEGAAASGARVVIEQAPEPLIVGVVSTGRALGIDRDGAVVAEVERFSITARREVLLRTPGAFLQARGRQLELFGDEVLARGRDLFKVLAAMIRLN